MRVQRELKFSEIEIDRLVQKLRDRGLPEGYENITRAMVEKHESGEPRRIGSASAYQKFRKGKCERCAATKKLHVHHVDGNPNNHHERNLKTLCQSCHHLAHGHRVKPAQKYTIMDPRQARPELPRLAASQTSPSIMPSGAMPPAGRKTGRARAANNRGGN